MIAQHVSAHHMTSHCITWHDTTQAITSHQITSAHITSHRIASKQVTSPPWNSRRLVHSKDMVWASRWSVALRTFYRQILSLLYTSFFFWNFRPRLARELLVAFKFVYTCLYHRYQDLAIIAFHTTTPHPKVFINMVVKLLFSHIICCYLLVRSKVDVASVQLKSLNKNTLVVSCCPTYYIKFSEYVGAQRFRISCQYHLKFIQIEAVCLWDHLTLIDSVFVGSISFWKS